MNFILKNFPGLCSPFILLSLLFLTLNLHAQPPLNNNGLVHQINFTGSYQPFTIPLDITHDHIEFFLDGGDGGEHRDCDARGGKGARLTAVFPIGTAAGELQPGGVLRFIVGQKGANRTGNTSQGGGGGGGGTAILYKHPNVIAADTIFNDFNDASTGWVILAVAGGGGGGFAGRGSLNYCILISGGYGGSAGTSGGEGDGGNAGGIDGNGGAATSSSAGAGGGYLTDGELDSSGGKKGSVNGGAGGYYVNSSGNPIVEGQGGWGYGGGGAGDGTQETGGGGGGGYSGGGGGYSDSNEDGGGGGGGSFISGIAISEFTQIDGGDRTNNPSSGYITYVFRYSDYPRALCKDITLSLNSSGNAVLRPGQISDESGGTPLQDTYFEFGWLNNSLFVGEPEYEFTCSYLGVHNIQLRMHDLASGALNSCSSYVTVVGHRISCTPFTIVAPVGQDEDFVLPISTVEENFSSNCGAIDVTKSLSQSVFTCSDIGSNVVTLSATDLFGAVVSCTASVGVTDIVTTQKLSCPSNITTVTDPASCVASISAGLNPNWNGRCGSILSNEIWSPSLGSSFGDGPISNQAFEPGSSLVTYTLTAPDNTTKTCSFNVTVNDNEPPLAACKNITVQYDEVINDYASLVDDGSSDNCNLAQITLSQASFGCEEVGVNVITLNAIDNGGNIGTCSATVTVLDDPAPLSISCPANIVTTVDPGSCTKLLSLGLSPSWAGTCSDDLSYEITPPASGPFDPLPIPGSGEISSYEFIAKTSTVEYTITTKDNETASCSFTVKVNDEEVPTAVCQDATLAIGSLIINFSGIIDGGSNDNCSLASVVAEDLDISCPNVGANAVMLTVTDRSGNSSTCISTVTVEDNIPPTALCQDVTVVLAASDPVLITSSQVDNGSSDACGIASRSLSQEEFGCEDLGTHTIVLTVTDVDNNSATCSAAVEVIDDVAPNMLCQDVTVQLDDAGLGAIVAGDIDNGSSDICGIGSLTLDQYDFDCDDVGAIMVTLTAMDNSGNTGTCLATVTVEDNIFPVIQCVDATVQLDQYGYNGDFSSDIIQDGPAMDACGIHRVIKQARPLDCDDVGTFVTSITAIDNNSNSFTCSATVTVEDNIPPDAQCLDYVLVLDLNEYGQAMLTVEDIDNGSSDACGIFSRALSQDEFNCNDIGTHTIVLNVQDVNGNSSTCSTVVEIRDETSPVMICQDVTVNLDENGLGSIAVEEVDNGSSDPCGIASLAQDQYDFDCDDVGSNTVILTAIDNNGNTGTCLATVTVVDNIPPVVPCKDVTVQLGQSGAYYFSSNIIKDGPATDACGILSTSGNIQTLVCEDIGTFTASITATDDNFNTSTCTATVTVEDNLPPDAQCQDVTLSLDENGLGNISAEEVDNASWDPCGIGSLTLDQYDFDCEDLGAHTLILSVMDNAGNIGTCSATVVVEDQLKPTLTCPENMVISTEPGLCGATHTVVPPAMEDNCGITLLRYRFRQSNSSGLDFPNYPYSLWLNSAISVFLKGNEYWKIQLEATDASGNVASCTYLVHVIDNEPPTPVCLNSTVTFNGEAEIEIPAEYLWDEAASSDNCTITTDYFDIPSVMVSCDQIGSEIPVTITILDAGGNSASCISNITVEGLPCDWNADENGIGCTDGSTASYDPNTQTFSITSTNCYSPSFYRPTDLHGYIGTNLCGNSEIVAHVAGITGAAFAGLTMRESLDPSSKMIQVMVNGTGLARREMRISTGGLAFAHLFQNFDQYWVRLTRTGNQFGAYLSADGQQWNLVFLGNIPMVDCLEIGLITMNEVPNSPATAYFDQVSFIEYTGDALQGIDSNIADHYDLRQQPLDFGLYPNPSSGKVNVQLDNLLGHQATIEVFSHLGQKVFQKELGKVTHSLESLDLSQLANGSYFVKISTESEIVTRRLVLSR